MSDLRKYTRPEIEPENPWAHDVLRRQSVAEYLTPLVASISQPIVIGLHAPFGGGKSFFLEAWRHHLESEGFRTVTFNAWETDFSDNPLFAFIAALRRQLPQLATQKSQPQVKRKLGRVLKVAGGFMREKAAPLILAGLVRKAVGESGLNEFLTALGENDETLSKLAQSAAEQALKSQETAELSLTEFRHALAEAIEALHDGDDAAKRKLVIFVDELDRCRPTYAIEVLETIKHLFSVRGVVFVLGCDEAFLRSSVSAVYGDSIDAEGYLKRFIDWRFYLPLPRGIDYAQHLFAQFDLASLPNLKQGTGSESARSFVLWFGHVSTALGLTLRDQEQLFTEANVVFRTTSPRESALADVLGLVLPLKAKHSTLVEECASGRRPAQAILDVLDPLFGNQSMPDLYGSWARARSVAHGWFLSAIEFRKLQDEHNNALSRWRGNVLPELAPQQKAELEGRIGYLGRTLDARRSLTFGDLDDSPSPAGLALLRLARANLVTAPGR